MRREDREVTDPEKIKEIISQSFCCRLGLNDKGQVYIVPLNFGYIFENGNYTFYFHGAGEGRKIDIIKTNPDAGFEMDTNCRLNEADVACGYSAGFQSIIGNGHVTIVESLEEKKLGLELIMEHYTGKRNWDYSERALDKVCVFKLIVKTLSCKEHL